MTVNKPEDTKSASAASTQGVNEDAQTASNKNTQTSQFTQTTTHCTEGL
jgi:hypothetical protein